MEFTGWYETTKEVLDVLIIGILLYFLVRSIRRNQKVQQIFGGIVVIILMKAVAAILDLVMVNWVLNYLMIWSVLGFMVIFQPEIRVFLQKVGMKSMVMMNRPVSQEYQFEDELKRALIHLSNNKTGALITIEGKLPLDEFIASGVIVDAAISSELLGSIFFPNTPLHDGAVVLRGERLHAAGVFYPSTNEAVSVSHGARHRAAVAISAISDATTFVVSEETGTISVAKNGLLTPLKKDKLRETILSTLALNAEGVVKQKKPQ